MNRIEERLNRMLEEHRDAVANGMTGRKLQAIPHQNARDAIRVEIIEEYTELLEALELIENLRILVDNPSAWDCFSQDVSDAIRVILPDIDAAIAKAKGEELGVKGRNLLTEYGIDLMAKARGEES